MYSIGEGGALIADKLSFTGDRPNVTWPGEVSFGVEQVDTRYTRDG